MDNCWHQKYHWNDGNPPQVKRKKLLLLTLVTGYKIHWFRTNDNMDIALELHSEGVCF
jgi:hypothetical protein